MRVELKKKALTLVEVLISLAIITPTVLALYSSMYSARSAVVNSRLKERAILLVNQRLEEIAKCKFKSIKSFSSKYPDGKEEKVSLRTFSSDDFKSKRQKSDFTPTLIEAQLNTFVENFIDSCKISVQITWGNNSSREDLDARTVSNHIFKYQTD